jgi:hypothetical protein
MVARKKNKLVVLLYPSKAGPTSPANLPAQGDFNLEE